MKDYENEYLTITGTVHIGYGKKKQSVPFKSSYWNNVNGSSGTEFKWKRSLDGDYESILVEFGDELLKFKKSFMVNYDLWHTEPTKQLKIGTGIKAKDLPSLTRPEPVTPENIQTISDDELRERIINGSLDDPKLETTLFPDGRPKE